MTPAPDRTKESDIDTVIAELERLHADIRAPANYAATRKITVEPLAVEDGAAFIGRMEKFVVALVNRWPAILSSLKSQPPATAEGVQDVVDFTTENFVHDMGPICLENTLRRRDAQHADALQRWSLALQSLTPGGSEYINDPERCVAVVRERLETEHRQLLRFKAESDQHADALRAREGEIERLRKLLTKIDGMLSIPDFDRAATWEIVIAALSPAPPPPGEQDKDHSVPRTELGGTNVELVASASQHASSSRGVGEAPQPAPAAKATDLRPERGEPGRDGTRRGGRGRGVKNDEPTVDCDCDSWAETNWTARNLGNGHNSACAKFEPYVRGMSLMSRLVEGIKSWGADADGIHEDVWQAYREAEFVVNGRIISDQDAS